MRMTFIQLDGAKAILICTLSPSMGLLDYNKLTHTDIDPPIYLLMLIYV